MSEGAFLWGWDGTNWVKLLLDAAGHLQVDILSGAAVETRPHGYDGADWQTLLVEAAALRNLRVRLYDGANGLDSELLSQASVPGAERGLDTISCLYVYDSFNSVWKPVIIPFFIGDGDGGWGTLPVAPWVWNGATWDKMRSWTGGIQKVGRAEIDSTTVRKVAVGAVVGGAHDLYWVACSPDAPNAEWELTDAIAGGGAVVYDHFDADKHSEHLIFDPPMKFATGIWIETFTNMKSLVFCYV